MQNNADEARPYKRQAGSKPPGRKPLHNRSQTVPIAFKVPNKLRSSLQAQVRRLKKMGFKTTESELIRLLLELNVEKLTNLYLENNESNG